MLFFVKSLFLQNSNHISVFMKKLLFLFVSFIALQVTAQTADKQEVIALLKTNGKSLYYSNLFDIKAKDKNNKETQITNVIADIADIYDDYLTAEDVIALQQFYNSATGKKLANGKRREFTKKDTDVYVSFSTSPEMEKLKLHNAEITKRELAIQKKWVESITK